MDCKHVWIIEPPNGTYSKGTCKICNQEKEFRNSLFIPQQRKELLADGITLERFHNMINGFYLQGGSDIKFRLESNRFYDDMY